MWPPARSIPPGSRRLSVQTSWRLFRLPSTGYIPNITPSRGYPFNITASTAYDQKFIKGRNIFENISQMVDEIFNSYIRRTGFVEPLAAKFCNGTTTTCDGLSQWGSQAMAEQGADSVTILRNYYGDNIEIVNNAPVMGIRSSYPGTPVRLGDRGEPVVRIQTMLNRISRDYPAIPKVQPVDGIFGASTEQSVIKFQQIFSLTPDGVVGNATWYKLVFLYVGVLELAELVSEGQTFYTTFGARQPPRYHFPRRHRRKCQGNTVPSLCGGGVL